MARLIQMKLVDKGPGEHVPLTADHGERELDAHDGVVGGELSVGRLEKGELL